MSAYYGSSIQEKMVSVQLVINASFCHVLKSQGLSCVSTVSVFLCQNDFGKPTESFKIENCSNLYPGY